MKRKARTGLKRLRWRTGLSLGQVADALGWPKSSYVRYEETFTKPYLPQRLASQLVPVFEFFGIHRFELQDLFEPGVDIGAQTMPPLVLRLDPKSREDAARIEILKRIKEVRAKTVSRRKLMFLENHLSEFEPSADAPSPPHEPRVVAPQEASRARNFLDRTLNPVMLDVLTGQSLGRGELRIDFKQAARQEDVPFHLRKLQGLYALTVTDPPIIPGRLVGGLLLAAPAAIQPGDMTIVTWRDAAEGRSRSIIGLAVSSSETAIEIHELGTNDLRAFARSTIDRLDRVLTTEELLGWVPCRES